jgi:hypothetical protein
METLAQIFAESRANLPTGLGSAGLRDLGSDILRQSLFSARMTNATAVQGVREAVNAILSGADNIAERRYKLKVIGQALGYDPAKGFPGDTGIPPAEAGDIRDLFSTDRLNLILQTQQEMCQGAAKNIWGNEPDALEQYPAWELVRVAAVEVPRGQVRRGKTLVSVPSDAWNTAEGRWPAACAEAGDDEAQAIFDATGRMVARKGSAVWQALGDGAGGYEDTLGNDYEPFAYQSGMGRVEISRQEFADLGGDPDGVQPGETDFGSGEVKLSKDRFDPDILQTLKKALESGDLKYRVEVRLAE